MDQRQAAALAQYLNRAHAIIPTTGAEWDIIRSFFPYLEGIATGVLTCTISPVQLAPAPATTPPAEVPKGE
jgi:hypothetical protein